MINLRKLTILVLTLALLLTLVTPVCAADAATVANADKAATLKDLGLYTGKDANDPKVGLEDALTTQDALIFLSKLFGYNDAANALTAGQVDKTLAEFDDAASISEYAKNVVAYSATNGIVSGSTQDDNFFVGAKDTVTAARFATFMLKQMGYTVADYQSSVAKLAEIKGSKVDATVTGDLTRDAAVGVMYGALTAEKTSGKTVIADIVGDNADLKAIAEKTGLIASSVTADLMIESVTALNPKQIAIKFNIDMDKGSAEDKTNYKIQIEDKAKEKDYVEKMLTDNSCKLGADKRTVTITFDVTVKDCLENSSKAKVIVSKDIMSSAEKTLGVDKEFQVEVQDNLLPAVKEVKATGEKNIQIIFSEPVYEGKDTKELNINNFKVTSGTYEYYITYAELDLDVINLQVSNKLIKGPIDVTVNNAGLSKTDAIQDYSGKKVLKETYTFNYIKDDSVAVVTVSSASENTIVLHFSKPVKATNLKLYYSAKNVKNYEAETTTAGYVNDITFRFSSSLPNGTFHLFLVNSKNDGEALIDPYGIKVPDQTLTTAIVRDTTPFTVTDCKVDKNKSLKITFSRALDRKTAEDTNNYVVERSSDNRKIPFSIRQSDSTRVVELEFLELLEDNTEYQLVINISGNTNEIKYEYNFTTGDHTYPKVMDDMKREEHCSAIAAKGEIFIIYSEPMIESQMLDKENYQVSTDEGKTYTPLGIDDKITKLSDRKIQIYIKAIDDKDDGEIAFYVKIAPIMDLTNKRLYNSLEPYVVKDIYSESVSIDEAQLITKNKMKMVFSKQMKNINMDDIVLTSSTTSSAISIIECESNTLNADGKTEIVLILDKALTTDVRDEEGAIVSASTIAAPSSESEDGLKLKGRLYIYLEDKVAPEVVKWDHDDDESTEAIAKVIGSGAFASHQVYGNDFTVPMGTTGTITIFFSEAILESDLNSGTFEVDGFTVTGIRADAEKGTIVLDIEAASDSTSVKTTVTGDPESLLRDSEGNLFTDDSTWTVILHDYVTN